MLHRSALVAGIALIALSAAGGAYPQSVSRNADRAVVAPQATQVQRAAPSGPIIRAPLGPTIMYATTSLSCSNANGSITTITLSVNGGNCVNGTISDIDGSNVRPLGTASCSNSGGDQTSASCSQGCKGSSGSGSCTSSTSPPS
jgi:hypothetical protein